MKVLLFTLALASSAACVSGQIVNAGFETGNFTGWSTSGDADIFTVSNYDVSGLEPFGGNYYAALHANSSISQGGLNLAVGQTVTFWMAGLETSANSSFLLVTRNGDPTITVPWHLYFSDPSSMFPDKYSPITYTITEAGIYTIGAENLGPVEPSQLGGGVLGVDSVTITGAGPGAVPEPASYGLVAGGLLLGVVALRRRARSVRDARPAV